MSKIGIFIPCYNVSKSIRGVLESFSADTLRAIHSIVVTDNCSTDNTLNILKEIQNQPNELGQKLIIIKNHENYGLGGTQKIAYQYFLDNQFSHFFIIHGDGQADGELVAQSFLKAFKKDENVDWIIASRFAKGSDTSSYDKMRTIGNHVFNFLTYLLTGHKMTDSGAAILFYRTALLESFPFWHLTNSFQFNPQLNILLFNANLKLAEVPLIWKDSKDESNIKGLNYCKTMLKILMRYRWNKSIRRKVSWQMFHDNSQKFTPSCTILKQEKKEFSHGLL